MGRGRPGGLHNGKIVGPKLFAPPSRQENFSRPPPPQFNEWKLWRPLQYSQKLHMPPLLPFCSSPPPLPVISDLPLTNTTLQSPASYRIGLCGFGRTDVVAANGDRKCEAQFIIELYNSKTATVLLCIHGHGSVRVEGGYISSMKC